PGACHEGGTKRVAQWRSWRFGVLGLVLLSVGAWLNGAANQSRKQARALRDRAAAHSVGPHPAAFGRRPPHTWGGERLVSLVPTRRPSAADLPTGGEDKLSLRVF